MAKGIEVTATINIHAPVERVWEALTKPELIKQYLMGTDVITDWNVGGPIIYRGVWHGKEYEDKGIIIDMERAKRLVSTYWSSLSGTEDLPENYATVTYILEPKGDRTIVRVSQDNNATKEAADHARHNWNTVLRDMKKTVEK